MREIIDAFESYYAYAADQQEKVYEIIKKIINNPYKNLDLCKQIKTEGDRLAALMKSKINMLLQLNS